MQEEISYCRKIFARWFGENIFKDAYLIASAILAECNYFITVDKRLLKYTSEKIRLINPVEFLKILEE